MRPVSFLARTNLRHTIKFLVEILCSLAYCLLAFFSPFLETFWKIRRRKFI